MLELEKQGTQIKEAMTQVKYVVETSAMLMLATKGCWESTLAKVYLSTTKDKKLKFVNTKIDTYQICNDAMARFVKYSAHAPEDNSLAGLLSLAAELGY